MDIRLFTTDSPEYKEMVELRLDVLLRPIGAPESYIDPQKERSELLVGAFEAGILIGCCVLTPHGTELIQLRQMAVRQDYQGKGIGAAIVAFTENISKERGFKRLMMHARDVVIPFYEKSGYTIVSEQFTEVGIEHHRMEKDL
jgi:predicted GNAT family N-acyltransferase